MRRIIFTALLLLNPLFVFAATPAVNSSTINYISNQITINGSGFLPAKTAPTVLFNNAKLTLVSDTNTAIVATLPTGMQAGTFNLTVTNSQGSSVVFDVTYGATGPQGVAGPAGPAGPQGPAGPAGATGPAGPAGATGPRGPAGPAGAEGAPGTNGIGFTFLNAYNPNATYAENSVVSFNGSSYIAIVANGPNPNGPTPDQNPSWSLMAQAGATGPAGPTGAQGPIGLTGATGPAGPAGATGATGPQGPRGLTGAPGAPGDPGANGIGFTFLSAYNPNATYVANDVVTFNGSSYIAILANGPDPNGPTPDQNPSWSLMAAGGTGTAGPAGPAGPQGPAGPMGLTGPAGATGATGAAGSQGPQGSAGTTGAQGPQGAQGPAGPQGPAGSGGGGVLSYAVGNFDASQSGGAITVFPTSGAATAVSATLQNAGTYIVSGQVEILNTDPANTVITSCAVVESSATGLNGPTFGPFVQANIGPATQTGVLQSGPATLGFVALQGRWTATTAGDAISIKCSTPFASTPVVGAVLAWLTAIQVQ